MTNLPFVGREAELERLLSTLHRADTGNGSVVLIEGGAGLGKSLLISALLERIAADPGLKDAVVASGNCYEESGPRNAYQPFVEILSGLTRSSARKRGALEILRSIVGQTAPDWLQVIPVIGPLLSAGAKTAIVTSDLLFQPQGGESRQESMARQYAQVITELAKERLLVLVIEDAHWIDHASCELVRRLAAQHAGNRIVILLTYRATDLGQESPLARVRSELVMRDSVEMLQLGGLTEAQIADYLQQRFGTRLFDAMPRWLRHLCQGHPLFVTQFLSLLEQEQIIYRQEESYRIDGAAVERGGAWEVSGRLGEMPLSGDLDTLLDQRIQRLEEEEREMLQIGAVQGEYFGSLVLAQVFQQQERTILARLRRVSERHRIISLHSGHDWMADRSEVYAFEHLLMHQAFYRKLGPRERVLNHREIAAVLEKLAAESTAPPRKLLLDIAFHHRNGRRPLEAARHYLAAAKSSYRDGGAVEAAELCDEVLQNLREVPPDGAARDELFADCVLLYLIATSYGALDLDAKLKLVGVAAEGEAAAQRAGRRETRAQIMAYEGHLRLSAGGVAEGIAMLREALEVARTLEDRFTEFFVLVQLGKQLSQLDLEESLEVRHRSLQVYEEIAASATLDPARREELERQYANLLVQVGVGELDRGDFERAIDFLERGVAALREHHLHDDLLVGLNFLGQVFCALGRFEEAERCLRDSLTLLPRREEEAPHPWIGYNLALLGKVYVEWGRFADAEQVMEEAVRITEATRQLELATLVWNYQAEQLMHRGNPRADLEAAEAVLLRDLREAEQGGYLRSAAQSDCLLARLEMRRGRPEEALRYSTQAVELYRERGDMPAMRTEEILFTHHRVLRALGRAEEAAAYLAEAHEVLEAKAARLRDPERRESFLRRVPLSRDILAARAAADAAPGEEPADAA